MVRTHNQSPYKNIKRQYLRTLAQRVWDEHQRERCEVTIAFVDLQDIVRLNQQYLGKDTPTDVIAFHLGKDPEQRHVGDVYICPEVAEENSLIFGTDLNGELARLVVHAMLHLLGYEDKAESGKKRMQQLENEFLEKYPRAKPPNRDTRIA